MGDGVSLVMASEHRAGVKWSFLELCLCECYCTRSLTSRCGE